MDETLELLQSEEASTFIRSHIHADPQQLLLNPPKSVRPNIRLLVDQILARNKAKGKLEGWHLDDQLIMPPPVSVEQASSETTAAYKRQLLKGDLLVDLTGGMGIDCLALSQNFERTIYVEKDEWLCKVFAHNARQLSATIEIAHTTAEQFVEEVPPNATIFVDPARRTHDSKRVFRLQDCLPNLQEILPGLRGHTILLKLSPLLELRSILGSFPYIEEVHVVSVRNDCKELLVKIGNGQQEPPVICVNLETDHPKFIFSLEKEKLHAPPLADAGKFIFEPNSSILKAGAFQEIANTFEISKLGKHSHLYTSERDIPHFPGKRLKVLADASRDQIDRYAPDRLINVITRNHPLRSVDIKEKYKLKDGGEHFLIAYRDIRNKPTMKIARRV